MKEKRILIGALTYERPDGLRALMRALVKLTILEPWHVEILIVDNSQNKSAADFIYLQSKISHFQITYISQPERGIALSRNTVLDYALDRDFTHLIMIDDDEIPRENWLLELLYSMGKMQADVVIGAVKARFISSPPQWIKHGGYLNFDIGDDLKLLREGNSSNAAISLDFLRAHPLRFDPEFNLTGGEDTYFFMQIFELGGKITFAKYAIVEETIVPHRAQISWLFARWRRTGNTSGRIFLLHNPRFFARIKIMFAGFSRIIAGIFIVGIFGVCGVIFPKFRWSEGFRILARGIGFVMAGFGSTIVEYQTITR